MFSGRCLTHSGASLRLAEKCYNRRCLVLHPPEFPDCTVATEAIRRGTTRAKILPIQLLLRPCRAHMPAGYQDLISHFQIQLFPLSVLIRFRISVCSSDLPATFSLNPYNMAGEAYSKGCFPFSQRFSRPIGSSWMCSMISLERRDPRSCITAVIVSKFRNWQPLSPVVLFEAAKTTKVLFIYLFIYSV